VWAALKQGDETPRLLGHVTWDPMVHMGPTSLFLAAIAGIAWGLTPVQPANFRSRRGEAIVAAAGPIVNLLLALLALTALGLWSRGSGLDPRELLDPGNRNNFALFLLVFGATNMLLLVLNLLPLPPLDGATVLGDFAPGYRRMRHQPELQPWFLVALIAAIMLLPIGKIALRLAGLYLRLWQ
jgi:Zn-dependent protease